MNFRFASAAARGRACGIALGLALFACGSPGAQPIPESKSRFDSFTAFDRALFDAARRDMQDGRDEAARDALAAMKARRPDQLVVGVWLQEVEIALAIAAAESAAPPGVSPAAPGDPPAAPGDPPAPDANAAYEALRERYRRTAESNPTVANFVLAARLEPDTPAAMLLLDRAEELDADCAWIHYGRAFLAARTSDWAQVRVWIARAHDADPGHLPTRWLEAWMLAQGGNVSDAIAALEVWLARARGDLRLDGRIVRAAELDLAILCVLDGDPGRARQLLAELGSDGVEAGRSLSVAASTEQALGAFASSLAAAQRAEAIEPGELLPVVQQAMLYDNWLDDPVAAEAAWTRVLAMSRASPDLSTLLERMRARVRLERFQAQREKARAKPISAAARPKETRA